MEVDFVESFLAPRDRLFPGITKLATFDLAASQLCKVGSVILLIDANGYVRLRVASSTIERL